MHETFPIGTSIDNIFIICVFLPINEAKNIFEILLKTGRDVWSRITIWVIFHIQLVWTIWILDLIQTSTRFYTLDFFRNQRHDKISDVDKIRLPWSLFWRFYMQIIHLNSIPHLKSQTTEEIKSFYCTLN